MIGTNTHSKIKNKKAKPSEPKAKFLPSQRLIRDMIKSLARYQADDITELKHRFAF
jgi:hypothetical protein